MIMVPLFNGDSRKIGDLSNSVWTVMKEMYPTRARRSSLVWESYRSKARYERVLEETIDQETGEIVTTPRVFHIDASESPIYHAYLNFPRRGEIISFNTTKKKFANNEMPYNLVDISLISREYGELAKRIGLDLINKGTYVPRFIVENQGFCEESKMTLEQFEDVMKKIRPRH
jgi:hypothetical protein